MTLRALLASACVLALPLLSQSQTMELARVQAAHASLRQAQNQDDRLALHGQLQSLWVEAAEAGQLMDVDWTSWNEAVVDLGDGSDRVVVYTWNVELDDRTQRYGGWVAQAAPESELGYTWTALSHDLEVDLLDNNRMHRHDRWQGGLYYDGVLTLDKNTPVYTMLAWDGADGLTNRKWVETIDLRNGRVRFGSPRFELADGLRKRHVMAYADAVQAVLRIEREPLRIIMDDLAPQDPAFQGQPAFYGPTLSYNALTWKNGRWHFQKNIAVANPEDGQNREYRDPSLRRRRRNR